MIQDLSKALAEFQQRLQGLKNDGYQHLFTSQDKTMIFVKLVHRNGNRVSVVLRMNDGTICQRTNGKIVFPG